MIPKIALLLSASLALGASCVASEAPEPTTTIHEQPTEVRSGTLGLEQHFCCTSVDTNGKGSGEGCTAIGPELINACDHVLYCAGNWAKQKNTTECL